MNNNLAGLPAKEIPHRLHVDHVDSIWNLWGSVKSSLTATNLLIDPAKISAAELIKQMQLDVLKAKDNLQCTKISQAIQCNKTCMLTFSFRVGD